MNDLITKLLANSLLSGIITSLFTSAVMSLVFSKYGMYALGAFVACTFIFWIIFVGVMSLQKRKKQLIAGIAFYSMLSIGFIIDVLYNFTFGSLVFWEWAKELTLSQRMTRHIRGEDSWRKSVATWICKHLVEPWDFNHCHLQDTKE